MTRIITLLLSILFLSGCITQQKCAERYPPQISDSVIVQRHDSIVIIHDTIQVPYQELTIYDDSPCPPSVVYHKSISSNGLTSSINIKDGKITTKCQADSLKVVVESKNYYIETLKRELSLKVNEVIKFNEHWYNPWSLYISIASIVWLLLWVYFKIAK